MFSLGAHYVPMKYLLLPLFFIFLKASTAAQGLPDVPLIYRSQLDSMLSLRDDTTRVINFWATWCRPCVAELPYFFEIEKELEKESVVFIYITLDFKRERTGALRNFINKRNLRQTILLLDEPDYNSWIDRVDPSWQGAIPATIVWGPRGKKFHEGELNREQLRKLVAELLR